MDENIKPIIKWAGGKTQMLPKIIESLPKDFHKIKRYVEPFLGAGAVFLHLINTNCFEEYVINDINDKLMNVYVVIRDNCHELISELTKLKEEYLNFDNIESKQKFYYDIRDEFNAQKGNKVRNAALFIFLNKTCFNGLYRENAKGKFNVPFGQHTSPGIFDEKELTSISNALNSKNSKGEFKVKILCGSFEALEKYIDENTFVYFDPPYRPVTAGGFNSYNKSGFNDNNQVMLKEFYCKANEKGAKLMLSNSDPKVLDINDDYFDILFADFNIKRVCANRMINSNGNGRGAITEILVTNYERGGDIEMGTHFKYKKDSETFDYLLSTLKDSIKGWDYFVNWDKVKTNVKELEIQLNILNYLIGKDNIKDEAKFLIKKHPEVLAAIPVLVACRDRDFQIITAGENNVFTSKNYSFSDSTTITEEQINDAVEFMKESQILNLISTKAIKNLVDYVFGVEVGLDSNGRKNRSGHAMEVLVESFISKVCNEKKFCYLKEATPNAIKSEWGYDVTVDKSARRFDFAINTGNKLYLIEANYYGGGGSKLKATAGEYKTLQDVTKSDGNTLIWVTDGKGWLTANRPLEETFYHNDYIVNLTMLEQGFFEEVLID